MPKNSNAVVDQGVVDQGESNGSERKETKVKTPKLTATQVRILQTLARNEGGLTRTQIQQKAGAPALITPPLGPSQRERCKEYDERNGYPSLHSLDYVRVELHDMGAGQRVKELFVITDKGKEAAHKYATRKKPQPKNKIPRDLLVPVVKEFRALRTYGYELYTDEDIKEIKDRLNGEYSHVTVPEIRQQIANLRKVGAFKEEKPIILPDWYTEYREGEHWQTVQERALAYYGGTCAMNSDHEEDVQVWHRNFDNLGGERTKDLIPLCKECRNRARKSLPPIPDTEPGSEGEDQTGE